MMDDQDAAPGSTPRLRAATEPSLGRRGMLGASAVAPLALALPAAAAAQPAAPPYPSRPAEVELTVNGQRTAWRSTPAPRCSTRCATHRPHRHQEGLRPRPVRRLHRACGRQAHARLPDSGGHGARPRHHHRGPGQPGRAAPDAAGLHRARRLPVRLLHAGPDHVGRRLRQGRPRRDRRRHPGVHERQPVPLRRLPAHRRGHQPGQAAMEG